MKTTARAPSMQITFDSISKALRWILPIQVRMGWALSPCFGQQKPGTITPLRIPNRASSMCRSMAVVPGLGFGFSVRDCWFLVDIFQIIEEGLKQMTILGKLAAYIIPSVLTWSLGVLYDKKPSPLLQWQRSIAVGRLWKLFCPNNEDFVSKLINV